MSLADLHQPDKVQDALALGDVPKLWCSVIVQKGRHETACQRTPKQREWIEVLVHAGETDIVIYPVCTYHYNRHLADGVVNSLGKLLV